MLKAVLVSLMLTLTAGLGVVAWVITHPVPPAVQADAPLPPPPTARATVLAAARAVQAGDLLKPEDIGTADVPSGTAVDGARSDSPAARAELVGAMARRALSPQQPLLPADILRPTEGGFLAAVLAPNHRAVSVAVDAVSGTAGLIWPGDRVDLILTQSLDDNNAPAGRRTFGETVLQNLRVIAVDQQLVRGTVPDAAAPPPANRTITLEVLPEAAERVAVAVRLGKVALTVRGAEEQAPDSAMTLASQKAPVIAGRVIPVRAAVHVQPPPAPPGVATTWGSDVSPGLGQSQRTTTGTTVRVFQGAANEKEFRFE